jgi:serine/threonine protein kinase
MTQLLFALDGLHSTGIVHGDIKLQNIIFSEGNDIKISSKHKRLNSI